MEEKLKLYGSLFYLSLVAFLWPLLQEYGELSLLDFSYASVIFLIIVFLQLLVVVFLESLKITALKLASSIRLSMVVELAQFSLVAVFLGFNVYFFCFTLLSMNKSVETYIALALIPVFFYLIRNFARLKNLFLFTSIFLALSIGQFGFAYFTKGEIQKNSEQKFNLEKYQRLVELKSKTNKRNIYLISFDGVASPESLRSFYGVESAEHIDYLNQSNFRVLDSAFSGGFNTRLSFFNMLKLGEQTELVPAFFSTRELNPTYTLLEDVGYKVQFLFRGNYMGSNTNTLDYFYPEKSFITLCDFIDQQYAYIACNPGILFGVVRNRFGSIATLEEFFEKVLERVVEVNRDEGNWVSIAHVWFPGHAPHDFVYNDFERKESFIKKTLKDYSALSEMIKRVVEAIRQEDENPVIIIYSDHGAWLTKGLDYGQSNEFYSEEDIYLEKNGILFSVFPAEFCAENIVEGYNTANLIIDMLECENE